MSIVLSLCDYSTVMVQPWLAAGYECWCVDIKHPKGETCIPGQRHCACGHNFPEQLGKHGCPSCEGDGLGLGKPGQLVTVGADIRSWLPPRAEYAIAFAFPPCTHLARSGGLHFKRKGISALIEGLELVEASRRICDWTGAPWMVENPVGTISSYWRKPDYYFHPYEYAGYTDGSEAFTKRTCLWTGNGFVMPTPKPVPVSTGKWVLNASHSSQRQAIRSLTPAGFAQAVYEANHK